MNDNLRILSLVKIVGLALLFAGLFLFSYGFFGTDYNFLTPIGIGTIVASVFIFIMGLFFIATEEILMKVQK